MKLLVKVKLEDKLKMRNLDLFNRIEFGKIQFKSLLFIDGPNAIER